MPTDIQLNKQRIKHSGLPVGAYAAIFQNHSCIRHALLNGIPVVGLKEFHCGRSVGDKLISGVVQRLISVLLDILSREIM